MTCEFYDKSLPIVEPRFVEVSIVAYAGDEQMKPEFVALKYGLINFLGELECGMTAADLDALGVPDAWETISQWVDRMRRG